MLSAGGGLSQTDVGGPGSHQQKSSGCWVLKWPELTLQGCAMPGAFVTRDHRFHHLTVNREVQQKSVRCSTAVPDGWHDTIWSLALSTDLVVCIACLEIRTPYAHEI